MRRLFVGQMIEDGHSVASPSGVRRIGRTSFSEEKEAKRLLIPVGCSTAVATPHRHQKCFGYFFSKK
jgi:hypothetical protein